MRTEYVIPLTAKLSAHLNKLEEDKNASESAAEIKRLEKDISDLHKKQAELSTFDEKLRHYADMRIALDLRRRREGQLWQIWRFAGECQRRDGWQWRLSMITSIWIDNFKTDLGLQD